MADSPRAPPPPDPFLMMSAYRRKSEFLPIWERLPWHLRHPALAAFGGGLLVTVVLWILAHV